MTNRTGNLIARERLARGWSQEGLCRGICAVSYLSKIESGRAEASEEILSMLLSRLGIQWSSELEAEAESICERAYEALFTACYDSLREIISASDREKYRCCAAGFALALLEQFAEGGRVPLPTEYERFLDSRALALQRILQGHCEEAIALMPIAYTYFEAGAEAYSKGEYISAMELLYRAYNMAAEDGSAKLMLLAKLFLSACCANRRDLAGMEKHNMAARRLAEALGDSESLEQMAYNSAATAIECGKYEEAYAYFSNLEKHETMSLHKLAICCEMTGRRQEAFAALDKAETAECRYPPPELAKDMCSLVRYRLENKDYLQREIYGEKLLAVFDRCRRELSAGYAWFHLPWVLEWYKAGRQYKKVCELLEEFPEKLSL